MTTFLSQDNNFAALPDALSNPETAGVVVIPVPYEATSTFGKGSRQGPDAILQASQEVELFDAALGFEPVAAAGGIATRTPIAVDTDDPAELADRLCKEVRHWRGKGKFVVTLGGEHTSVLGAIRACCEYNGEITVLQLDAHSDLRPQYLDDPWNHACAMARALDFHHALVQVGIRSQDAAEKNLSEKRAIPVFYAHEIHADAGWVASVIETLGRRVYVTLDCDVMDPSIMPATGTPEPGGLTWRQIDALLRTICAKREVVGLDVSELAPIAGIHHPEFTVAKLVYRFIGHRFAANLGRNMPE